ncbi:hypothetical protein FQN53_007980 [Emmonsiellopsis sp. PD_33]|nr:hypothetical protein FQN53_007980 [Emmonsiellopsis sp. PD_33]
MDINGAATGTVVPKRSDKDGMAGSNGFVGVGEYSGVDRPQPMRTELGINGNVRDSETENSLQGPDSGVANVLGSTNSEAPRGGGYKIRNGHTAEEKAQPRVDGESPPSVSPFPALNVEKVENRASKPISASPQPDSDLTVNNKETATAPVVAERPAVQSERGSEAGSLSSLKPIDTQQHSPAGRSREKDKILKLSPAKIHELTSSPESLALHSLPLETERQPSTSWADISSDSLKFDGDLEAPMGRRVPNGTSKKTSPRRKSSAGKNVYLEDPPEFLGSAQNIPPSTTRRKTHSSRIVSTPEAPHRRRSSISADRHANSWSSRSRPDRYIPKELDLGAANPRKNSSAGDPIPSPIPKSIPLPPFSIPTYLQLELASDRPSPLYIHRSVTNDFPYESSRAKLERLQNFFLLPPILEQVLLFGTLACLDAWLYYFTILPLRFFKAIFILLQSWVANLGAEAQFISGFVITGVGRVWRRRQRRGSAAAHHDQKGSEDPSHSRLNTSNTTASQENPFLDNDTKSRAPEYGRRHRSSVSRRHRRTKSVPSSLLPDDKADILKGLLMVCTCLVLMYFDASRMYHWIRGQAAIKLYVIYNVLEVGDRLFSAIGQDVLECLFSQEALERKPDGRSKILRPFWLFILALIYTVIHSTALFYQVITLNVAVNSYSNALITLLLSNQFVEIKSTVFKKFEKENLFQLTCADVVERFQLWLMLTIIASRNIVETGIFSFGGGLSAFASKSPSPSINSTTFVTPPRTASSILPQAFTVLPSSLLASLSKVNSFLPTVGHLLGPFLVVLGSEMLVDWLKHAYVNKFNNTRPAMYGRFLDILAKDYYTHAFADQNLNRRLGLPVIPLACLFFRVSVQTYQMFLTAWLPQPQSFITPSNTTSLTSIHDHYSPSPSPSSQFSSFTFCPFEPSSFLSSVSLSLTFTKLSTLFQTIISHLTPSPASFVPIFTVILILLLYLTLLLAKLILGIILLSYSRARYKKMKLAERDLASANSSKQPPPQSDMGITSAPPTTTPASVGNPDTVEGARRVGGWGYVEVGEDRRRWVYADDPEGARRLREREERDRTGGGKQGGGGGGAHGIEGVMRYEMAAKRIW